MLFSKISGTLTWSQGTMRLSRGMSIDDDHALVAERPDLFTDEDPGADVTSTRVQTTMQKPGEKRNER
jgi:hypothetical protein